MNIKQSNKNSSRRNAVTRARAKKKKRKKTRRKRGEILAINSERFTGGKTNLDSRGTRRLAVNSDRHGHERQRTKETARSLGEVNLIERR